MGVSAYIRPIVTLLKFKVQDGVRFQLLLRVGDRHGEAALEVANERKVSVKELYFRAECILDLCLMSRHSSRLCISGYRIDEHNSQSELYGTQIHQSQHYYILTIATQAVGKVVLASIFRIESHHRSVTHTLKKAFAYMATACSSILIMLRT